MKDLSGRLQQEPSIILRCAALGLYVLFVCNLLGGILPLRLIDPAWQLGAIRSLETLAFLPLIATCLILLGSDLKGTVTRQLGLIRRGAALACIGFLLLIPLQVTAMWRLGILVELPASRTIATISSARSEIGSSQNLAELNAGLAKLPGAPKLPPGFNQPLATIRQDMQRKLGADLEKLRSDQQQRVTARKFSEVFVFIRGLILDLVLASFFGMVAGFTLPRIKVMRSLLNPFSLISKRIESMDRQVSAKRRAARIAGQPNPVGQAFTAVSRWFERSGRRRHAKRQADKAAAARRSRRP